MKTLLAKLWQDRRGQDMTEYALIAGLVSTVTFAIVPEMLAVATHLDDLLRSLAVTVMGLATVN
jgi:Flp pilus assembly pilin Flp